MKSPSSNTPAHQTSPELRILDRWQALSAMDWDALPHDTPFTRYHYLSALQTSESACTETGWNVRIFTLWQAHKLIAACPLYIKNHSRGEYVFDWIWARAYAEHGLHYYPKAVIAVPFTPVQGRRLLGHTYAHRQALLQHVLSWIKETGISSLHLLFADTEDTALCQEAGLMLRDGVQFHWHNQNWTDFDDFLSSLNKNKRKKIRQERERVAVFGIHFSVLEGHAIGEADWDFFYRCYSQTYWEHGNTPYLSRDFFREMANNMPKNWVLFLAQYGGQAIACSLLAIDQTRQTAYGRYWGALQRVSHLHFELCYYQPLAWCIANRVHTFEGGAQGEHKMARALLPTSTQSAHWIASPEFSTAITHFLENESMHIKNYEAALSTHQPFKRKA